MTVQKHPEHVQVGAITYRVSSDPDEWMRYEHDERVSGNYGATHHKSATILLNPESTDDVTRLTLWHEVLHAMSETLMGAPEWRHLGKDRTTREESVVRLLESPTLTILRDNPDLVAYLTR